MKDGGPDPNMQLLNMATEVRSAYVSNNTVPSDGLSRILMDIHATYAALSAVGLHRHSAAEVPSIPIQKSISPERIVCLEDGKSFKSLKRHLASQHGLSPDDYRRKWNLPADYPLVAANYSAKRAELARTSAKFTRAQLDERIANHGPRSGAKVTTPRRP